MELFVEYISQIAKHIVRSSFFLSEASYILPIFASLFSSILSQISLKKHWKYIGFAALLFSFMASSYFSINVLMTPTEYDPILIASTFVISMLVWGATFHIFAKNFGRKIKSSGTGVFSKIINSWVKSIDYIYLLISTFSIVKIVMTTASIANGMTYYNAFFCVMLGMAVALRITRTSIEIFGWDK